MTCKFTLHGLHRPTKWSCQILVSSLKVIVFQTAFWSLGFSPSKSNFRRFAMSFDVKFRPPPSVLPTHDVKGHGPRHTAGNLRKSLETRRFSSEFPVNAMKSQDSWCLHAKILSKLKSKEKTRDFWGDKNHLPHRRMTTAGCTFWWMTSTSQNKDVYEIFHFFWKKSMPLNQRDEFQTEQPTNQQNRCSNQRNMIQNMYL